MMMSGLGSRKRSECVLVLKVRHGLLCKYTDRASIHTSEHASILHLGLYYAVSAVSSLRWEAAR